MKTVWQATVAHLIAVFFAAFSLVVLIPHPHLWHHLPGAADAYNVAMRYAGPLHIVLGAVAVWLYTDHTLGRRRAAQFAAVGILTSLSFELLGTGTGWPFGNYRYLSGLGYKIGGLVPFSIPLSWYMIAFSGYGLAVHAVARWLPSAGPRVRDAAAIALGVWLLMSWDLVLDPAMAHEDIPLAFWVWEARGAYLGMPLINLAGWIACGLMMIGGSRWLWGSTPPPDTLPAGPLYAIYAGNLAFGAVICASIGLWWPIALGAVAGVFPATLAASLPPRASAAAPPP